MALAAPSGDRQDGPMASSASALDLLLGGTWFVADIPAPARRRLAALASLVDIADGHVVLEEGMRCRELGVVVEGRLAIRLRLPGGDDRTILTLEPGDVFGWSAVLEPATATSTVVAVGPTRAIVFDGERLRSALGTDCELAAVVYQRLLSTLARRLVATRIQLLDLYAPLADAIR